MTYSPSRHHAVWISAAATGQRAEPDRHVQATAGAQCCNPTSPPPSLPPPDQLALPPTASLNGTLIPPPLHLHAALCWACRTGDAQAAAGAPWQRGSRGCRHARVGPRQLHASLRVARRLVLKWARHRNVSGSKHVNVTQARCGWGPGVPARRCRSLPRQRRATDHPACWFQRLEAGSCVLCWNAAAHSCAPLAHAH